ncbi:MAG: hypothetical protein FWD52_07005 [Candidatus Bathyarchaeota archaeon]|nr:hypothetical protein [Candidatus Termiticorpusculum sp.]
MCSDTVGATFCRPQALNYNDFLDNACLDMTADGIGITRQFADANDITLPFHNGGVAVRVGGEFILVSGEISNCIVDGHGAGVANRGTFVMLGGVISNNGAFLGGGVYNGDGGNFTMLGLT